jgi:hypothetical protein
MRPFAVIAGICSALHIGVSYAAKEPIVAPFWAGSGAQEDTRVREIRDHHACSGQIAYAEIDRLPALNSKGSLRPETVIEFDNQGKVLRRWPMPADAIVVAVSGNEILVPYTNPNARSADEMLLAIGPDRTFSPVPAPYLPEPLPITCPALKGYKKSSNLRCLAFRDVRSKATRRIAYEGPCT